MQPIPTHSDKLMVPGRGPLHEASGDDFDLLLRNRMHPGAGAAPQHDYLVEPDGRLFDVVRV